MVSGSLNSNQIEEISKFIPLDKSWIIRMGILDLLNNKNDIISFLDSQTDLGGDLKALKRVASTFNDPNKPLDVGESGTIYRFVRFTLWKLNIQREIITSGTLIERSKQMCNNPEIINWSINDLLKLDGGTSQWATMSVLLGNDEKMEEIPYYLRITYDTIKHWKEQRARGESWKERKDPTLTAQALAFLEILERRAWTPDKRSLEDCDLYCFFRAFNYMTKEQGEKEWPHIQYHETDRLKEMEEQMSKYEKGFIDSKDHRIVQALVLKSIFDKKEINVINKNAVNKTWPLFWDFIDYIKRLN